MLKNYFKIAYRSLIKNKLFSLINILGLALAIPFALIAMMQIQSTYESDNFHPYPDRTYRVISDVTAKSGMKIKYASTPFRLAEKLKSDYPFIERATTISRQFNWELTNKIKTIKVNSLMVEPGFFDAFGFKLDHGTIPSEPNTLLMTADIAKVFFGESDPVGKIVSHPEYGDFKISGVLKPFKRNTHFRTDVMVSISTLTHAKNKNEHLDQWTAYEDAFTYVVLDDKSNPEKLKASLTSLADQVYKDAAPGTDKISFDVQSLKDISPDTQKLRNNPYVEDWADLSINFIFAFILVVLAGFNYTNLTLARSLSRAKEVGIRKVSGALRGQLMFQFICEALLIAMIALLLGFFIFQWMREFIHVNWFTWEVDQPWIIGLAGIVFTLLMGVIAGVMPAWLLSGFQPVSVLKGTMNPMSLGKVSFRKSLTVIQFVVTTCFIFMIGHMYHQFKFMATDNINFNRKDILNISLSDNKYKNLVNDIHSNKNVAGIGLTSTPFGYNAIAGGIKKDPSAENLAAYYYAANAEFISNMKLTLVSGKNLPELTKDSADNRVLINEQAALALG
ncbi:MAG: ABC transporter permease, partial [Saprospiraceae bacterium]